MFGAGYGGKRGFAAHLRALLGRGLPEPDWPRVDRLVFVCKGNICRSAYAEGRASALGLPAASAGLEAPAGDPANAHAIERGAARGVDLALHRTTPFAAIELRPGDLVLAMEPAQAAAVTAHGTAAQVALLGDFATPRRPYLHDPYGLADSYWTTCLDSIDTALAEVARRWRLARL